HQGRPLRRAWRPEGAGDQGGSGAAGRRGQPVRRQESLRGQEPVRGEESLCREEPMRGEEVANLQGAAVGRMRRGALPLLIAIVASRAITRKTGPRRHLVRNWIVPNRTSLSLPPIHVMVRGSSSNTLL